MANVPDPVIGDPVIDNPVGTDNATDVTVPTLYVRSADKSNAVPLIVIVLVDATPPNPDKVYSGILKTPVVLLYVDAPLDPVVVNDTDNLDRTSV
jgi:hypothetical protein